MQSLYRKWRPQQFSDLKGQDTIRDTIAYALRHGKLSQAYLFCGPRGTGKTTTARLIAKFVNCTHDAASSDPKPCNTCASCKTITDGSNFDVLELDAASNRGIDEIRQLRDAVRFAPTQAKYKVFIIDEVHMLTREAFNALLKTLEEPPSYTVFILATTEAHKIPPTITSRCQRYDFRLANQETLTEHLLSVAQEENMNLTKEGAQFLARLAEGSFRDGLSLLEQVKSSDKPEYSLFVLEELLGYIPQEQIEACLQAILAGNTKEAHTLIDAVLARGADFKAFCDQLLYLSQACLEGLVLGHLEGFAPSLVKSCREQGIPRLLEWVELLLESNTLTKQSPIPRLPLDIAITKFALGGASVPMSNQPENKETKKTQTVASSAPAGVQQTQATPPVPGEEKEMAVHETAAVPVAVVVPKQIEPAEWQKFLSALKEEAPSLVTSLSHAQVMKVEHQAVTVGVRYKMHADKINQMKNKLKIETALQHVFQVPLQITAEVVKDLPQHQEEEVDIAQVFELDE